MRQEVFISDEYCNRYSSDEANVFVPDVNCNRYSSNEAANTLIPDIIVTDIQVTRQICLYQMNVVTVIQVMRQEVIYQMNIVTDVQVMMQEVFIPDEFKYCNIYPSNEARGVYNVPDEY